MFGKKPAQLAQAKILADEGYGLARNSANVALQRHKYIVEVHPDNDPAFRTEVEAWVSWPDLPQVGDVLKVKYTPGSTKVDLGIKGDPRFDWELRKEAQKAAAATTRDELLRGAASQEPLSQPTSSSQSDLAAHEAELFAKLDELRKGDAERDEP